MAFLGQIVGIEVGVGPPGGFKVVCSKENEGYFSWVM